MPDLIPYLDDSLASPLERAIAVWIDAKANRSQSAATAAMYRAVIAAFRARLHAAGLDLDSDPPLVALAAQGWAGRRADGAGEVAPVTFNKRLAVLRAC